MRVLCWTFIKYWNFISVIISVSAVSVFWFYCKYSIFHIVCCEVTSMSGEDGWISRTHTDSPVSPRCCHESCSEKNFSLFSSIYFGWGWLASSFFFCLFLIQNTKEWNFEYHIYINLMVSICFKANFLRFLYEFCKLT